MGCTCLCARNRDLPPDAEKPKELSNVNHSNVDSSARVPTSPSNNSFSVHLRHEDSILKLKGKTDASFQIISVITSVKDRYRLYSAKFCKSEKECQIKAISKSKAVFSSIESGGLLDQLSHLDHSHILQIYDVCHDREHLYIVTETYHETLHTYVTSSGVGGEQWAAIVFMDILSVVAYCHQMGVVIRGIDPDTVVFKDDAGRNVKVMGLENTVLGIESRLDYSMFKSPEEGKDAVTEKTDIWSCGVLLYYLLSGRLPSPPESHRVMNKAIQYKGVSFNPEIWGTVSKEATDFICSMLTPKAEQRPSAMQCLSNSWLQQKAQQPQEPRALRASLNAISHIASSPAFKSAILRFIINRVVKDSQLSKLSAIFDTLDSNRDGLISEDELAASLEQTLQTPSARAVAKGIIEQVDINKNGMIDYSEFLLSAFSEKQLMSRENLRKTFDMLDRDGSGRISIPELRVAFALGSSEREQHAWRLAIADCDTSQDGEIDFAEFEHFMKRPFRNLQA